MTHPTTPTVTAADRELLATEYEREGWHSTALKLVGDRGC